MPKMVAYDRLSDSTPSPPQSVHISSRRSKDSNGPSLVEAFGGIAKKRAPKACVCCRRRKVRCDVSDFGSPCSNCRFDKAVCIVKESRRNRRRSNAGDEVAVSAWKLPTATTRDRATLKMSNWKNDLDGVNIEEALTPGFHDADDEDLHVPHLIYQLQEQKGVQAVNNVIIEPPQVYQLPLPPPFVLAPGGYVKGLFPPAIETQPPKVNTLSPIFRSLPGRIAKDDVEYLWAKGALSIPEPQLQNELLRSYFEHVHSHMPIIDIHEFVDIVEQGDGLTGQLSLLLFQCVMFAGSAFIGLDHLKAIGFATRFEARKAFFTKVRVLYDLDYENDRISLVQSLLLMTHWYEEPDDQKDLWYWTGVASSLSLQIGLHRPCTDPRVDSRRRKLYKRIGWACFIRDQLVALGTQRPTRIKSRDHTLSILTLSDFDLEPISEEIACVGPECVLARDPAQMRCLASICIQVAKLGICMGHVLDTQYTMVKSGTPSPTALNVKLLVPKSSGPESDEVLNCNAELEAWKSDCAADARYTGIPDGEELKGQEPINGHRALLDMIYHASVIMLYRPLSTSTDSSLHPEARSRSAKKVEIAAAAITRTAQELLSHGLVPFIPSHGPTVVLQAIMVHLVAATSPSSEGHAASIEGFTTCMNFLHVMRDVHNGADVLIRLIELGMKQRGALNAPTFPRSPSQSESRDQAKLIPGTHGSESNRRRRTSDSSSQGKSPAASEADLMAVLGARTYSPPISRKVSSHQTVAPDPRLLFESSGLMVDERLFGGWPVAKALLQTMLGLEEGEFGNSLVMGQENNGSDRQEEINYSIEVGHADFMEYVDEMVDFGFGEQGEASEKNGELDGIAAETNAGRESGDMEVDLDVDLDMETPSAIQREEKAPWTESEPQPPAAGAEEYGNLLLDIEELRSAYP